MLKSATTMKKGMITLALTFNDGGQYSVTVQAASWPHDAIQAVNLLGNQYNFTDVRLVNNETVKNFTLCP